MCQGHQLETRVVRNGAGFVTDVTDVKIRSMSIIKHHQICSSEGGGQKCEKSLYYYIIKKSSSSIK